MPHLKLRSTKESTKGGSIYYGLWHAYKNFNKVAPKADHHLLLYTDADLSAHLGQIGIAIDKTINQGFKVTLGSRKIDAHLTQRPPTQMKAGKLYTYLLNNLFPDLKIADTQSGFKLLRKEILQDLFKNEFAEYGWCFDVEILLLAHRLYPGCIKEFGFIWIDSVAESKTRKADDTRYYLKCYIQFYKGLARLYQKYAGQRNQRAESFHHLISALNVDKLETLLEHCPSAITERSDLDLLTYRGIQASNLETLSVCKKK